MLRQPFSCRIQPFELLEKISSYRLFFKYIFAIKSFKGEHFSQATGVLVKVRKPEKIAVRWHFFFVSFFFCLKLTYVYKPV